MGYCGGGGAALVGLMALTLASVCHPSLAGLATYAVDAGDPNAASAADASAMLVDTQLERFRIRDICGADNRNLRLYLDYADSGWVTGYARSHQLEHMADDFAVKMLSRHKHYGGGGKSGGLQRSNECTLELVTCPSCRIRIGTSSMRIVDRDCESSSHSSSSSSSTPAPPTFDSNWTNEHNGADSGGGDVDAEAGAGNSCKCNYISFVEPPFDAQSLGAGRRICSGSDRRKQSGYTGHTRSLMLHFSLAHTGPEDAFNLTMVAERNLDETFGKPGDARRLLTRFYRPGAVLTSPYFPDAAPRDLIKQHLITCTANGERFATASSYFSTAVPPAQQPQQPPTPCSIRVLFTDFQIDLMSRLEFFDSDGDLMHMYTGLAGRPPVLVFDGPSLLMRFYANGGAALRYRAEVDFLPPARQLAVFAADRRLQDVLRPRMECGGMVDTLGGAITMMDMVANETERVRYDCVWLVRPSERYMNAMPQMSLRVDAFEGFVEHSELTIYEGLTSAHPQLGIIQWAGEHQKKQRINVVNEFVLPTTTGFYVRFQGTFGAAAKLALVYTVFNYESSKLPTQFECLNRKRIPLHLQCDGFDHCGDNSDETDTCQLAWKHDSFDRRWYSHTPNYYFPKAEQLPDLRAATMMFLVGTGSLVLLVGGIVMLLYRMGHWAQDRHEQSRGRSGSGSINDGQHMVIEEDLPDDLDPPAYEAPPAYDEVIKVGMDEYYRDPRCKAGRANGGGEGDGGGGGSNVVLDVVVALTADAQADIDRRNMALDASGDGNLVSLTSMDNLTLPCQAMTVISDLPAPTTADSADSQMATTTPSTASTVVEIIDPISICVPISNADSAESAATATANVLWTILTADPTLDGVVIIDESATSTDGMTTATTVASADKLTTSTSTTAAAAAAWTLIESVAAGEQCVTAAASANALRIDVENVQQHSDEPAVPAITEVELN